MRYAHSTGFMSTRPKSWVMRGLHTLLTEGRSVEVDVMACGASGRVMMLNAIQ
jgi:hypothetical protein